MSHKSSTSTAPGLQGRKRKELEPLDEVAPGKEKVLRRSSRKKSPQPARLSRRSSSSSPTPASSSEEEEERTQDSEGTPRAQRKRNPPSQHVKLNRDQMEDLAQWWQENKSLYVKTLDVFKDRNLKDKVVEEQANKMNLTKDQLSRKMASIRTLVGRQEETKSGQAAVEKTDWTKWILQRFSFLKDHIRRQAASRSSAKLPRPATSIRGEESDLEEDESDVESAISHSMQSCQESTCKDKSRTKWKSSTAVQDTDVMLDLMKQLLNRCQRDESELARLAEPKSARERKVKAYTAYLREELMDIDPVDWLEFVQLNSKLIEDIKRRKLDREQRSPQFSQQQYPGISSHLIHVFVLHSEA